MFLAAQAAIAYRRRNQGQQLRPSELVLENFLLAAKLQPGSTAGENLKRACIEVSFVPQLAPGEELFLHQSDMKLGRYAYYLVCGPDYVVVKASLGNDGWRDTERAKPTKERPVR